MDLTQRTEAFNVDDPSWLASRHGTGEAVSVTLDTSAFTPSVHYPDGFFKSGIALGRITATGKYGPYAGQTNEVQSVTITGSPTGGTFTLTWSGQTTAAIPYNATAAQVQSALQALSNVGDNDVTVTGGPGPGSAFAVTFKGVLGGTDVAAMTASGAGLTGGTTPGVTIGTTTAGGANPAANDGTESLAGFLAFSVGAPSSTSVDVVGAMFDHCKVVNAKLPVPVDAAGRADVAGRIIFY
ncbi:hypothetical protein N8J89_08095 [Crossiella sp. CA-258035]|uniref:hypothetical protein n=1 Tax=Crossiella sp. CA-258035 TaxID=2981138 RepID=UPI0024BC0DCC|nr:hypothetical protein [Crossiella sp. CA-258035]WHT21016.1 hypothetical protein N8J89_08095 [Crossiella sp. CA-258035]